MTVYAILEVQRQIGEPGALAPCLHSRRAGHNALPAAPRWQKF